jgi:hypothetical protein
MFRYQLSLAWLAFALPGSFLGTLAIPTPISPSADYQLSNITLINGFQAEVICLYPVSGQFTILQRILYYFLMIFAIAARSHEWLVVGALASAMTYSGIAAIYGIAAAAQRSPRIFERDDLVVWLILMASALLAIPLLNWSSTIRRLHARTIIIYWAIFIVIGTSSIFTALSKEIFPSPSLMTCAQGPDIPPSYLWPPFTCMDEQFLQTYSCSNPCTNVIYPNVFRSPSDQTLPTLLFIISPWFTNPPSAGQNFIWVSMKASGYTNAVVGIQGLLYIGLVGRRSPREVRNLITSKIVRHAGQNPRSRKIWRIVSKTVALVCYIWMVLVLVICPALSLLIVATCELGFWNQVEAESPTAIGQWSPWATVALTVAAAIISKYHARVLGSIQVSLIKLKAQISKLICFCTSLSTFYKVKYHTEDSISIWISHNNDLARGKFLLPLEPPLPSSSSQRPIASSQRTRNILKQPFQTVTMAILAEWRDLVMWYKDPC